MDLYEILEINPTASELEIRKAYYRLSKIYHPDKNNKVNANEKFQRINSAYEILINEKTRLEYLKMNMKEKYNLLDIINKIIEENINIDEFNKYGIKMDKTDLLYLQNNFINFIKNINFYELIDLIKNGKIEKKTYNTTNLTDTDCEYYDETMCEYYYNLPIYLQKINKLDIKIDININISDIKNKNKRKIKLKRKMEDEEITSTFIFYVNKPYIVFIGGGDMDDGDYGNLIVKLNIDNDIYWDDNIILIYQSMTLYEMIYGLDINIELGEENIKIKNWIPSRDGFYITMKDNIGIKLYLDYKNSEEKHELLRQYFN